MGIAAHSVDHLLSLSFFYLYFYSFHFGFKSGIRHLIAPVSVR